MKLQNFVTNHFMLFCAIFLLGIGSNITATQLPDAVSNADSVQVIDEGNRVILSNGILYAEFEKSEGRMISLKKNDGPDLLAGGGRAYMSIHTGSTGDNVSRFEPEYRLVRHSGDIGEISFHDRIGNLHFTLHYVLKKGDVGIYAFIEQKHFSNDPPEQYGQTRWGIRANPDLFNYHLTDDDQQGPMPSPQQLAGAEKIQDATYLLSDGSIYTKYNWSDYIDNNYVHGMCGSNAGTKHGMFVIKPSHEWMTGVPTHQVNTTHQTDTTPFFLIVFNDSHFLPELNSTIEDDWVKIGGPIFIYPNTGESIDEIWQDAKQQAEIEKSDWPYTWMQHEDYCLERGELRGRLTLQGGRSDSALIVLAAPEPDWQLQNKRYMYYTRTDSGGWFSIPHVVPGTYTLYSSAINVTEEYRQDNIVVSANTTTDLGDIDWIPVCFSVNLWQLGIANRVNSKGEFKFCDYPRQYGLWRSFPQYGLTESPPENLTFTIGSSTESQDWYYCQTKKGNWDIQFDLDVNYSGDCVLTLGLAGTSRYPTLSVFLNNQLLKNYAFGQAQGPYRSAILGNFYEKHELRFPASKLKVGANRLRLMLTSVKDGGGIYYDVIKLEIDDPNATLIRETDNNQLSASSFVLHQNYPNPFNPSTTISYQLFETNNVNLTVYDTTGRHIDTLVDKVQTAGYYTRQWTSESRFVKPLASGLYFAQLKVGLYQKAIRLLLMR